jgi:hypothetical protein
MPTYDQFEVEHIAAYSGNYVSKVMNKYGTIFNTGSYADRQIADSATGVINPNAFIGTLMTLSDHYAYSSSIYNGVNSPSLIRSFERSNEFFSDEIISDTLVANPLEFYSKNVPSLVMTTPGVSYTDKEMTAKLDLPDISPSSSIILALASPGSTAYDCSPRTDNLVVDMSWPYQFPYQSYFKPGNYSQKLFKPSFKAGRDYTFNSYMEIVIDAGAFIFKLFDYSGNNRKVSQFSQITFSWMKIVGDPAILPPMAASVNLNWRSLVDVVSHVTASGMNREDIWPTGMITNTGVNAFGPNIKDAYKYFFGYGKQLGPHGETPRKYHDVIYFPDVGAWESQYSLRVVPRGWKYGIQSAFPTNTKCIWRVGKFGQFRDMLEGRPTVAGITQGGYQPNLQEPALVRTQTYPLQVSFVAGTTTATNALDYQTSTSPSYNPYDSGIYDTYYRSGQPFFDRDNED